MYQILWVLKILLYLRLQVLIDKRLKSDKLMIITYWRLIDSLLQHCNRPFKTSNGFYLLLRIPTDFVEEITHDSWICISPKYRINNPVNFILSSLNLFIRLLIPLKWQNQIDFLIFPIERYPFYFWSGQDIVDESMQSHEECHQNLSK